MNVCVTDEHSFVYVLTVCVCTYAARLLSTTPVAAPPPFDIGLAQVLPLLFFWKKPAVCAPLAAAPGAVNCWLGFLSVLESARQRSKAFAFKALELRQNARGGRSCK